MVKSGDVTLAIDIGGTKIAWGLVDSGESMKIMVQNSRPFIPGKSALFESISAVVTDAYQWASDHSLTLNPTVAIGTPGRLIGPGRDQIAPGSAKNLSAYPGEFDNLSMRDLIMPALPGKQLLIENDAVCQFAGGLRDLVAGDPWRSHLLNQTVAYIGPGTGLGGGFCKVDATGTPTFFTDGHIFDIQLSFPDGMVGAKMVGAEDVLSGKAFQIETGLSAETVNSSPELLAKWHSVIVEYGNRLAKLVLLIINGQITKERPDAQWPQADIDAVRSVRAIVVGGSLGTVGEMGHLIRTSAKRALHDGGYPEIPIIPIQNGPSAALMGSAWLAACCDRSQQAEL